MGVSQAGRDRVVRPSPRPDPGRAPPHYPWYQDWADFFYWLLFFAYGYLFLCDERFLAGIRRRGPWALLGIALCGLAILPATVSGQVMRWEAAPALLAGQGMRLPYQGS